MNRALVLSLAAPALLVAACTADTSSSDVVEPELGAVDTQQAKSPFPTTDKCTVPTEGIGGGTRDGVWCCGTKTCNDKETCGDYYGKEVQACVDCHYYECIPVYSAPPPPRPVYVPPRGVLAR